MTQVPAASATLRALKYALENAPDSQIVRIVGMVQELEERPDGEDILAVVRARLRPLRPERKLRLSRLLFVPLQPVLADAAQWRPNAVTVPRSAIRPLCAVVAAAAPDIMAPAEAMIATATTRDLAVIEAAGAIVWPAAARILLAAQTPPADWTAAGLPAASFEPLARTVGHCLGAAAILPQLSDPTMDAAQIDRLTSMMLRQAVQKGPSCWGTTAALLICSVPQAQAPRDAVLHQGAATPLRNAAEAALAHVWLWIAAAADGAPIELAEAAASLRRRAIVLGALAADRHCRAEAARLQAELRAIYIHHLVNAAQERLTAPIIALTTPPDDAAMAGFEHEARGLRRLALELRALGTQTAVDRALRDAAAAIGAAPALPAIDRARLVEILEDTEAAMRLLAAKTH